MLADRCLCALLVRGSAGGRGDAELLQTLACQFRLMRIWKALHQRAQFADSRGFLILSEQGKALLQLRRGRLIPGGVFFTASIVGLDGTLVILLAIVAFADVKLGVGGAICILVILQIILEGLNGQIILPTIVIAQSLGIERVRVR